MAVGFFIKNGIVAADQQHRAGALALGDGVIDELVRRAPSPGDRSAIKGCVTELPEAVCP